MIYEALLYLHDDCNYSCDYCMVGSADFTKRESRAATPEGVEAIINFFNLRSDWHIFLSGGEPTVHPEFIRLARELSKKNYLRLDTNNSMDGEKLQDFIKEVDPERVDFIRCALHTIDEEEGRLEEFIQRAKLLKENGFNVFVEFVATPERIHKIPYYFERFQANQIPFVVAPFRDRERRYPLGYSEEEVAILDKYMISAIQRSVTETEDRKPLGKLCDAGYSRINISGITGNIRKCWRGSEVIGNIYENRLYLFEKSQVCDQESCTYVYESHCEVQGLIYRDLKHILSLPKSYDEEIYHEYRERSFNKV